MKTRDKAIEMEVFEGMQSRVDDMGGWARGGAMQSVESTKFNMVALNENVVKSGLVEVGHPLLPLAHLTPWHRERGTTFQVLLSTFSPLLIEKLAFFPETNVFYCSKISSFFICFKS